MAKSAGRSVIWLNRRDATVNWAYLDKFFIARELNSMRVNPQHAYCVSNSNNCFVTSVYKTFSSVAQCKVWPDVVFVKV